MLRRGKNTNVCQFETSVAFHEKQRRSSTPVPPRSTKACSLLAADENARVIAGGQTLVPMMAMRLARPTRLIDINRIAALSYIRQDGDVIAIGATTRQCVVERDGWSPPRFPCWRVQCPSSATRRPSARPSAARSPDPAAELPLIAVTLDATLSYRASGRRPRFRHANSLSARWSPRACRRVLGGGEISDLAR
jgi:CO/xanthine dehydrogenase FAD-binding subunit